MLNVPWDRQKKIEVINIGEFFASREPVVISTLLGSCVSACLFDPEKKIGGMNHILVPGKANFRNFNAEARYGINAMELLINALMSLGASRFNIKAKIFGGSKVLFASSDRESMGSKNVEFILEFLKRENIKIVSSDLGGLKYRRIFFHTDTTQVFLRKGQTALSRQFAETELKKIEAFKNKIAPSGDITFF